MQNDIMKVESAFFTSLGNPVKAGQHLGTLIEMTVVSRDTKALSKALTRAENDKHDKHAGRVVRATIGQVWPGAKVKTMEDGSLVVKITGCIADEDALSRVRDVVKRKLSLRDTWLQGIRPPKDENDEEPSLADLIQKRVENDLKWMKTHPAVTLDAYIAALQAQRNAA